MPLINRIYYETATYYAFEDFLGELQPKQPRMEITVHPGIDGESFRDLGYGADPSIIQSVHYVADKIAARDALVAYLSLIDGFPVQVFKHNVDYGYFRVAKIRSLAILPCGPVAGSIIPNPTALQYVEWHLISTYPPE